jgi:hypothetical protein
MIEAPMGYSKIWHILSAAAGVALLAGCGAQTQAHRAAEPLRLVRGTRADIMQAAQETLGEMHFVIDKFDVRSGVVHTEPLRAAQFFELWRSDNVGSFNVAEANLNAIRRFAEVRATQVQDGFDVDCNVWVQRLSLPENEVASVSRAYQMHSRSTRSVQRFELTRQQQRSMTWIDLGRDEALEAKILHLIARRVR